jgi:hypothetical protein
MSTPGMYSFLCKSTENSNKKCFGQVTFWGKVILYRVKHYIRVPKFFFITWGLWISKDAEFNVDFKNIYYLSDKMHLKKSYSRKRFSLLHRGPLVYWRKSLSWAHSFGHFEKPVLLTARNFTSLLRSARSKKREVGRFY